jgi:hypothetical protein
VNPAEGPAEDEDQSSIMDLVHGDVAGARELRANLAVFARRSDSPQIHRLVSQVLSGQRSVRDVFRTKEFNDVALKRFANVEKGIAQLTDEQRTELWNPDRSRTPNQTIDALRDAYDVSPAVVEEPAKRKKPVRTDDGEDFSQNTYAE